MSWDEEIKEIHRKRELAKKQGGEEGVARQHDKGRLTIRERIDGFLDPGSFDEQGMGAGSAIRDENGKVTDFSPANFVLGFGKVNGRNCISYATNGPQNKSMRQKRRGQKLKNWRREGRVCKTSGNSSRQRFASSLSGRRRTAAK